MASEAGGDGRPRRRDGSRVMVLEAAFAPGSVPVGELIKYDERRDN